MLPPAAQLAQHVRGREEPMARRLGTVVHAARLRAATARAAAGCAAAGSAAALSRVRACVLRQPTLPVCPTLMWSRGSDHG